MREVHNSIFVAHDDVARIDDLAADRNGDVQFARAVLVGATVDDATRVAREVFERGDVSNRTVDNEADATMLLGVQLDEFANECVMRFAPAINDEYMAGLQHRQGLVDHQVVTGTALYGKGRANELAGLVVSRQSSDAHASCKVVAQVRHDHRFKCLYNGIGGQRRRGIDAKTGKTHFSCSVREALSCATE